MRCLFVTLRIRQHVVAFEDSVFTSVG